MKIFIEETIVQEFEIDDIKDIEKRYKNAEFILSDPFLKKVSYLTETDYVKLNVEDKDWYRRGVRIGVANQLLKKEPEEYPPSYVFREEPKINIEIDHYNEISEEYFYSEMKRIKEDYEKKDPEYMCILMNEFLYFTLYKMGYKNGLKVYRNAIEKL